MTGALLNCYHPFTFTVQGVAQWLIRLLTRGADHTAILFESAGEVYVVEASQEFGAVVMHDYDKWVAIHKGVKYTTSFPRFQYSERDFKIRLRSQMGKRYDYRAVLLDHVTHLIFNRWLGWTDRGRASERFYCSELAMYVHKVDNWYRMSPADVEQHPDFINDGRFVYT